MSTGAITAVLEESLAEAFEIVNRWMCEHGLSLAAEKTEAIVITKKRVHNQITVVCNGYEVESKQSIRYLGVRIDSKLGYAMHAEIASGGAQILARQISHLMPNVRGPRQRARSLLASVVTSRLLYGAPIWADSMLKGGYKKWRRSRGG